MIMKTHELRLQITCIAMHRNFITERITRADSGEFTNNNDGINWINRVPVGLSAWERVASKLTCRLRARILPRPHRRDSGALRRRVIDYLT